MNSLLVQNESPLDRLVRVVVGLGAVSLVFVGPHTPFGWLGLILVATGALGSCPLYRLFGVSTSRAAASKAT